MAEGKKGGLKKFGIKVGVVLGLLVVVAVLGRGLIVSTNDATQYTVRQAAVTGTMSVKFTPGMMPKLGKLTQMDKAGMLYFSKNDEEGGTGLGAAPIEVQFNDGSLGVITGSIKYRLPKSEDKALSLHSEFSNKENVQDDLIRQVVTNALMQTAALMKAEDVYATRRAEFRSVAKRQIEVGLYQTRESEVLIKDAEGNEFVERSNEIVLDSNGKPIVSDTSPFVTYGLEISNFSIKNIEFDTKINELIEKKKEAEQKMVVARSNAEKAKQDAITEEQKGLANVAKAEAEEAVKTITEVEQAKRTRAVAYENAEALKVDVVKKAEAERESAALAKLAAQDRADAILAEKMANAKGNRELKKAGLDPLKEREIAKEEAIGVAAELAKLKFPEMMIIGGGSGAGGALNPFDAVGLESFIKIKDGVAQSATTK